MGVILTTYKCWHDPPSFHSTSHLYNAWPWRPNKWSMTSVKQHAAFPIVQCCICTAGTPALLASFLMMGCKSLHRSHQYCGGWRIGKLSVPKSMLHPCSKEARRAAPPVRGMAGTIIYLLAKSFSGNHGSDISPWTSAAGIQKITAWFDTVARMDVPIIQKLCTMFWELFFWSNLFSRELTYTTLGTSFWICPIKGDM